MYAVRQHFDEESGRWRTAFRKFAEDTEIYRFLLLEREEGVLTEYKKRGREDMSPEEEKALKKQHPPDRIILEEPEKISVRPLKTG